LRYHKLNSFVMSVCYYVLDYLRDFEGVNDTFLTSLVVIKHAVYWRS